MICFFLCWAPFHAQRLAYTWAMKYMDNPLIRNIFIFTTYASGILYYISTCINPLVYNIMSNKFRQAFKVTLMYIAFTSDGFVHELCHGFQIMVPKFLVLAVRKLKILWHWREFFESLIRCDMVFEWLSGKKSKQTFAYALRLPSKLI